MLKIIGGAYKRHILEGPPDQERSRPMPSRVKESLFNILRGWFQDARVLDLFAGVGTMGLEAASRGASEVVMVELDQHIHSILEANIDALGCGDRCRAFNADALGPVAIAQAPRPVDIAFIDPPYAMMHQEAMRAAVLSQVARLEPLLSDQAWVVLRTPDQLAEDERKIEPYSGPEVHEYSEDMFISFYFLDRSE